jgi:hypothetical protein
MKHAVLTGVAGLVFGMTLAMTLAHSQSHESGDKQPSLSYVVVQGPAPNEAESRVPNGAGVGRGRGLAACTADAAKLCNGQTPDAAKACLEQNQAKLSDACRPRVAQMLDPDPTPPCVRSVICGNRLSPGSGSNLIPRVLWDQTMGYKFSYPYVLPNNAGGVSAVGLDSKGNLWAFQRSDYGQPQLFKYGPDHKLLFAVPESVITHQYKAHGMKVDKDDNVWICDANGATVKELSPDGKLIRTIGIRGKRGDWDEAKGQRLLWQPVMVDFGPGGDIYIFEGHAEESPNDAGSDDPTNNIGAGRVIHLDKDGNYVNQWFGNFNGPGKFDKTHGSAVDPITGQVWIGDRMQYRIVVYTANGKFIRTIQMKNNICAMFFEPNGQLWIGTGQDGQYLKLDRDGNTLGAVGNGSGRGWGQFIDAAYFSVDSKDGTIYAPDTSNGRITVMTLPKK